MIHYLPLDAFAFPVCEPSFLLDLLLLNDKLPAFEHFTFPVLDLVFLLDLLLIRGFPADGLLDEGSPEGSSDGIDDGWLEGLVDDDGISDTEGVRLGRFDNEGFVDDEGSIDG